MPWTADPSITIDRFDIRANLDRFHVKPPAKSSNDQAAVGNKRTSLERIEERLCNYERYRCLIHNEFASVNEEACLRQIELDEKYGDLVVGGGDSKSTTTADSSGDRKAQSSHAAIGFDYGNNDDESKSHARSDLDPSSSGVMTGDDNDDSDDGGADSDMDIDVELDLSSLNATSRLRLSQLATHYGLRTSDFIRLLEADQRLQEELRQAKILEDEKLQLTGRRSRKTRRFKKERRPAFDNKVPRLLNAKVGLLHGQPITRRTVYLSASSSDSEAANFSDSSSQSFSSGSSVTDMSRRAQRTKPVLVKNKHGGPSIMIGGLTSVGLTCRRRRQSKRSERRQSSSSSSSSPARRRGGGQASRRRRHSRSSRSSSSSSSSSWNRRHRHGTSSKRSRVEFITTFGDSSSTNRPTSPSLRSNHRPMIGSSSRSSQPTTASALAASVVSKLLSSSSASRTTDTSIQQQASSFQRPTDNVLSSLRLSTLDRSRSTSPNNEPVPTTTIPTSESRSNTNFRSGPASIDPSAAGRNSSPPRRYYRPELESDEEKRLTDEDDDDGFERRRRKGSGNYGNGGYDSDDESSPYNNRSGRSGHSSFPSRNQSSSSRIAPNSSSSSSDLKGLANRPTPQQLLNRRVQLQLSKAHKADKKAELEKQVKLDKERQAREEGLRRQAALMRRQEEERNKMTTDEGVVQRRPGMRRRSFSSSSRSSSSSNSSRSTSPRNRRRSKSRSSPLPKSTRRSSSPRSPVHSRGSSSVMPCNLTRGYRNISSYADPPSSYRHERNRPGDNYRDRCYPDQHRGPSYRDHPPSGPHSSWYDAGRGDSRRFGDRSPPIGRTYRDSYHQPRSSFNSPHPPQHWSDNRPPSHPDAYDRFPPHHRQSRR